MATKFFTNEDKNTLLNKFKGIFEYRNIHYFDALVGYFRSSGYFRLRKDFEKVEEIRILVGIDVDRITAKYAARGSEIKFVADDVRADYLERLKSDIQNSEYRKEVEEGIGQFVEDIASGKVQLKAHPSKKIHAKIYIFREKEKHDHGYGAVITGSSNLSGAGLENNFEFNVELRDNADIDFATETFEKLWKEATDILPTSIQHVQKETYLNDTFTPFEVYIKFLMAYFGQSIEYDPNSVEDLPSGFKKLNYQVDAVNDGYNKLNQHNGFFLADVVGLGKTVVATMIARKFYFANGHHTRTLVICPPALQLNWQETFEKFQHRNYKIITNGSLHKVKYPQTYDLIIVDEAHKFRSSETRSFDLLQKLVKTPCKNVGNIIKPNDRKKRIILVSATPLNNRPEDLRNLIYLFQDAKSSTLEINLQHFFAPLIERYKKLKKLTDIEEIKTEVKEIYDEIRDKVLEPIIVRRTRTDIREHPEYSKDIELQGISFPDIMPPRKILYQLERHLEDLYDESINWLTHPANGLTYARYQAIKYLIPDIKKDFPKADMVSAQLAKIMKTLLIKRLDSSFEAFRTSIRKFRDANQAMIKMFENNKIFIVPALKGKVSQYIMEEEEEELERIVLELIEAGENARICNKEDFEPGFLEMLIADQAILNQLYNLWVKVKQDPKLDEFLDKLEVELMDQHKNPEKKLVVFSESAITTNYLYNYLKKKGRKDVLAVTSANRKEMMPILRANFDANYDLGKRKNEYNIVISTEVLAEGVNLHRSNVIVNYDTPWNSTRLMQRIGRVNRVGSKASAVWIYNFFPTSKVDNDIELKKKAIIKLQSFHAALGEDSQIFSRQEEYSTFGLFEKPPKEPKSERLELLMELRAFKKNNPEWFKRIQNIPLRARCGRKNVERQEQTIVFIKAGRRDSFFQLQPDDKYEELTFVEAAKIFKATVEEKGVGLPTFHYDHIQRAIKLFDMEVKKQAVQRKAVNVTLSPSEKKARAYINAFLKLQFINEHDKNEIKWARDMINIGRYTQLPKAINKLKRQVEKEKKKPVVVLERLINLIKEYSQTARLEGNTEQPLLLPAKRLVEPEIIISESFV